VTCLPPEQASAEAHIAFNHGHRHGFLRRRIKKAQTIIEYSLLIAVTVGTLLIIQIYFRRGVEGLLKQNVDNLGGERLTTSQYSPGGTRGATINTNIDYSGFDYEGAYGMAISNEHTNRTEVSRLR
jgi:hypothetical protein